MNVQVTVKPGAKKSEIKSVDGELVVYLHERAHDGEANGALIKALAGYYGVSKSQVEITRGAKSHKKVVTIIGM